MNRGHGPLQPEKPNVSPATARSILQLDFNAEDRARINLLAEKARRGGLSQLENAELETSINVGQLLAVMQSKARRSLRQDRSK
jgi:hypothetical protein